MVAQYAKSGTVLFPRGWCEQDTGAGVRFPPEAHHDPVVLLRVGWAAEDGVQEQDVHTVGDGAEVGVLGEGDDGAAT